jgi:hypothetical protein
MTIAFKDLNLIFYYLPITKMEPIVEKDNEDDDDEVKEFNYFSCHI